MTTFETLRIDLFRRARIAAAAAASRLVGERVEGLPDEDLDELVGLLPTQTLVAVAGGEDEAFEAFDFLTGECGDDEDPEDLAQDFSDLLDFLLSFRE